MSYASATNLDQHDAKRGFNVASFAELGVLLIAAAIAIGSYFVITGVGAPQKILPPPVVALLLVANLVPGVALLVLIGRRIAIRRAQRLAIAGRGRLHVRLVAVFSLMASVPIVLTVISASLIFQSSAQFWGSDRARNAFNSTRALVQNGQSLVIRRWTGEARAMAGDIQNQYSTVPRASAQFQQFLSQQIFLRGLYHGVVFQVVNGNRVDALYSYDPPDAKTFSLRVSGEILNLLGNRESYTNFDSNELWVVTPISRKDGVFLYVSTPNDVGFLNQQNVETDKIVAEYDALQTRSQSLQLRFNLILFAIALVIVGIATWIALAVADRLARPINDLVGAAHEVAEGNLTARVPTPKTDDEIGTLGNAFNQMTERLQAQTSTLESRRALIEAVMSGVSAGVILVGPDGVIRLINSSAVALLDGANDVPVGKPLALISPELSALLTSGERESIVELGAGNEARTLAVKVTRAAEGPILTFDDITGQLLDQRRAAWSDVARRIAHEIKNPLTPIQLAAERLQRRYGKQIDAEDTTFARLTDTIIRQVGDLRRMVDEFSSFARMPKPVFRSESLVDIARQTLFLHEVAHPGIAFTLAHDDPGPTLVCDRRQIGQALTNVVKNAVEAVEANLDAREAGVAMTLTEADGRITITLADTGIGLPAARDRIVEPYVTTRARGTGLGLAIVKKIVEEHFGTITFDDRPGGGTIVTICFDATMLATLDSGGEDQAIGKSGGDGGIAPAAADPNTLELQQNRT
ncbi:PAS domain-containing sensor histidine kinase [Sphingomonas sp. HMWF008]|nr:PAS domain-containing sensor histidine kinase [Sphingomonas sp. HMWF008]